MDWHGRDHFVKGMSLSGLEFESNDTSVVRQYSPDRSIAFYSATVRVNVIGHALVELARSAVWISKHVDQRFVHCGLGREKSIFDGLKQRQLLDPLGREIRIQFRA